MGYSLFILVILGVCLSFVCVLVVLVVFMNGMFLLIFGGSVFGDILCLYGCMESFMFWFGVVGFVIIVYCLVKNIKGVMIYGMVFVMVVFWFSNMKVIYFFVMEVGNFLYEYFKKVVDIYMIESMVGVLSFKSIGMGKFWEVLIIFLYVDMFDIIGILYLMVCFVGFINVNGDFEG